VFSGNASTGGMSGMGFMLMASRGGALGIAQASKFMEQQYNAVDGMSDNVGPTDDVELGSIKSEN
jgi:hypothetical protein